MERSIDELKEQIAQIERRIEIVKKRVERAQWLSAMLVRAKASHPRFPFREWEHRQFSNGRIRRNVDRVVTVLNFRLIQQDFADFRKDIPGVPSEQLYQPCPPTVDEVYSLVKAAAGFTSDAQVAEMFAIMRINGYPDALIDFALSR